MNKKIFTIILIILISFCFLSIVVADNNTHNDTNTTDHNKTIDKDNVDDNKTSDNNNTPDKNKTDDKSKNKYILAKGNGNNIKFSDGFRGFILNYLKSPASSGDEFKHVSTSKVHNANKLKLAIIECYKLNSTDHIAKIISDFVKTGSSNTEVGDAVESSHEKIKDHEVVKIDNDTEAVFDFEVLKSVSGNESDYFAYKVSFKAIDDSDKIIHQITNTTNATNTTSNLTNTTNITNATNTTSNLTNTTNITNLTQQLDNETNATFLKELYDYLTNLINALYDTWKPIINTAINYFLMLANALEELEMLYADFMAQMQSLMDAIEELLNMLESIWKELNGILKLLGVLLTAIEQLINLIGSILNFIVGLITAIISLIQQLLGLLFSLIDFILNLINQLISLLQAILDFLKSAGSFLIKILENSAIIITTFVIITIGALIYNRIR